MSTNTRKRDKCLVHALGELLLMDYYAPPRRSLNPRLNADAERLGGHVGKAGHAIARFPRQAVFL